MNKFKTSLFEWAINTENEWILKQFDYERNAPYLPKDYGKASGMKIYFKYPCGHYAFQKISDKTSKNSRGCPYCQNRGQVCRSLASEYPREAEMFMAEKNGITSDLVPRHSGKRYFWKCLKCGAEFEGKVSDVVSGHKVCKCSNSKISYPQYCIYYYIKQIDPGCKLNKEIGGYKFDIYMSSKIAIEYDGYPFHNSNCAMKNDIMKDEICKSKGIQILRIRDRRLKRNERLKAEIWEFEYDNELKFLEKLPEHLEMLGVDINKLDINVKRDFSKIRKFQQLVEGEESLADVIPELNRFIDQNDERNGKIAYITTQSHNIRIYMRDPEFPRLKWSKSAHELWDKKKPYNQWILMCKKMLKRYPQLEEQIYGYGNKIRCNSMFNLRCECGNQFSKTYSALMDKGKVEYCSECICKFRLKNIGRLKD